MKKLLSTSLVIALLASVPVAAVHAEKPVKEEGKGKGNEGGKGKEDKGGNGKDKPSGDKDKPTGDKDKPTGEKDKPAAETPAASGHPGKKDAVQKAVKTKKELIDLRQQLKNATGDSEELKAKYEELTKQLEEQTELKQALEVQKELLKRFYKPGDAASYEKLGELYEKSGDTGLKTYVNGEEVEMDTAPFLNKGRAMVPVRAISASLKAEVNWDADSRTVEIVRGDTTITMNLDTGEAEVNGSKVELDTAPVIKNGRVFLPLRFIGEQLKAKVGYQEEGDLIIVEDGESTDTTVNTDPATETPSDPQTTP